MAEAKEEEKKEEQPEGGAEEKPKRPRQGSKSLIIVVAMVLVAAAGGYVAYTQFFQGGAAPGEKKEPAKEKNAPKPALIALDPFVLNLSEHGRFLKVSMQLEIADAAALPLVTEKVPQLRDTIITLVSSKSADALASPEGKFQLKDEILLRANQAMGAGLTFKNLFFTEFVMQ